MQATTFRALGEPSRLQIVELLRTGPRAVSEIVDELAIRQPQVSKHLRVLDDAGIVTAEADGRRRIYHLDADAFARIAHWIDSFEVLWETRLDALGRFLDDTDPTAKENP